MGADERREATMDAAATPGTSLASKARKSEAAATAVPAARIVDGPTRAIFIMAATSSGVQLTGNAAVARTAATPFKATTTCTASNAAALGICAAVAARARARPPSSFAAATASTKMLRSIADADAFATSATSAASASASSAHA